MIWIEFTTKNHSYDRTFNGFGVYKAKDDVGRSHYWNWDIIEYI